MHSNIFVIFTLLANVWLKKQKMRIPIDVLYNEVRSKYQGFRIIWFLLEYSILHIKYEILDIMNDKQDLLLDQLNILCLIWHALKIVSVGHFSTQRRKMMSQLFCLQMAFLQIMVALVFYILIIVCNFQLMACKLQNSLITLRIETCKNKPLVIERE